MVLRRIKRRIRESGEQFVELHCGHVVEGTPESRYSRFYPCPPCDAYVQALRGAGAEQDPTVVLVAPPRARKPAKDRGGARPRAKAAAGSTRR